MKAPDFRQAASALAITIALLATGCAKNAAPSAQPDTKLTEKAPSDDRVLIDVTMTQGTNMSAAVSPDGETLAVTVLGCGVETVVNINGINVADVPAPISLSVESDKLGGTVRVGSTWATM